MCSRARASWPCRWATTATRPPTAQGAATEVDGLMQQAVTLMNTNVNGRYIFGGNKDQTAPFDTAGNYSGDTAVRQVEVAPGVLEDSSVRADVAVKGVGGGVDLFATLQSLSTALKTNNGDAIRGSLTDLTTATTQVTTTLAQVGAMGDAFATAQTLAKSTARRDDEERVRISPRPT